jgi:flagellar hook protein FlgE
MLGAIYIGLSGMSAYSRGLQTISNNVSNLNTPGFKASTVRFSDAFSRNGGGGLYTGGSGVNYTGSGVRYGGASINFKDGDMRETGNALDLGVSGRGFLILLDGDKTVYARTGSFKVDDDGYIIEEASGFRLAIRNANGDAEAVNIESRMSRPSTVTTRVTFSANLSADGMQAAVNGIKVFDANGGSHLWSTTLTRDGTTGDWSVVVKNEAGVALGDPHILKTNNGVLDQTTTTFTVTSTPTGAPPYTVTMDFATITNRIGGTTSSLEAKANGFDDADLQDVSVEEDGQIKLTFTNGESEMVGHIAMAVFRNPDELSQIGNGLFRNDKDLPVRVLNSDTAGVGKIVAGSMEASNVDLSQQFGDLILIQRGFQASSQVVSISNDMIQQLFGIRGQG